MIQTLDLFPQKIGRFRYEGDLSLYVEEIYKIYSSNKNQVRSVELKEVQWQSSLSFFNDYSFFTPIKEYIEKHISSYLKTNLLIYESWVNIFSKYGHSILHNHSPSKISGVLYLDTYQNDTFLVHNHSNPIEIQQIPIKSKDILFFKGDQLHSTFPNTSNQDKILIAFNMKVQII